MCDRPKLAPKVDEMQRNLSSAAEAPVTVAGRRAEGLGAIGRHEGIAAWSVALLPWTDDRVAERNAGGTREHTGEVSA